VLRISKLADYATVLLAIMAEAPERLYSSLTLAERGRLEQPTVAKLMKLLTQAGLLTSVRGAAGGYRLAHDPKHISVGTILAAIDGPVALTECSVHAGLCHHEASCGTRANWNKIHRVLAQALDGVSLADMRAPDATWEPTLALRREIPIRVVPMPLLHGIGASEANIEG